MKGVRPGVEKTVWKAKAEWFESTQLLPQPTNYEAKVSG